MDNLFKEFRDQWCSFNVQTLKDFLENVDKETRRDLVNRKCPKEDMNVLFYYCGLKDNSRLTTKEQIEIVKYLLEECGADVEMTGKEVVVEDNNSVHHAPPLWVTAIRGNVPLATVLLDHGADVNGRSNSQSAAVRTACYKNDEKMVGFLISRGADINIPNKYGSTCLMNAVKSASLVKLLIEKGANINARETKKMKLTAFHYSIHNESIDSFTLLLGSGADPTIPDKYGDSPLRNAACFLQPAMTELLRLKTQVSEYDVIESLELLGAASADDEEFVQSEEYWQNALELREKHGIQKEVKPPLPILGSRLEHTNSDELEEVCDFDEDQRRESVLIKWRILGPLHEEFLYTLLQYGYNRADNYKTLQIFICAHDLYIERNKPLHENNVYSLKVMIKIARNIVKQASVEERSMIIEDIFGKFVDVITQIQSVVQKGKYKTTSERSNVYNSLLFTSIYFAKFLLDVEKDSERFLIACKKLVAINPKFVSPCEGTLLHALIDPIFFHEKGKGFSSIGYDLLLDLDLIDLLLKSGLDVNSFDNDGLTCLHRFLRQAPVNKDLVLFLMDHGAHVDTVARDGENCLDLLRKTTILSDELRYRSLKCMAALVIGKFKIPYDGIIPFTLNPFVGLHHQKE